MLGLGRRDAPQVGQPCILAQRQTQRRISETPRNEQRLTGPRRAATHHATHLDLADDADRDRQRARPPVGVAAEEMTAEAVLRRLQAGGEAHQPAGRGRLGEGQRHQIAERPGRLGGEIGDVHRQRLPGDVFRRIVGEEMHALRHGVGLEDQLGAGLGRDQRAVVLQPERARRAPRQRRQHANDRLLAVQSLVNCHCASWPLPDDFEPPR